MAHMEPQGMPPDIAKRVKEATKDFTVNKLDIHGLEICGRNVETNRMVDVYKRNILGENTKVLMSVCGPSGSGKSCLAVEFESRLKLIPRSESGRPFVCQGKFSVRNQARSYVAFAGAFAQLVEQILSRGDFDTHTMQTQLPPEIVPVLSMVIPNVDSLFFPKGRKMKGLSHSPSAREIMYSELETNHEQSAGQLQFAFSKLLSLVANPSHPLVLVLDDVQWADEASIKLLENILSDTELHCIYVIATYRDNEVDKDHRYSCAKDRLRESVEVDLIKLMNLDVHSVNEIVGTVLRSNVDETKELALAIYEKTHGNPFFVLKFLQTLVDDGLLTYQFGLSTWTWQMEAIQARKATENVAELMTSKFSSYPPQYQQVLQVAAYLGDPCSVGTLSFVHDKLTSNGPEIAESVVKHCVEDGVIFRGGKQDWVRFVHDQVEEAAWKIQELGTTPHVPVRIGQMLLHDYVGKKDRRHDFLVADLCNMEPSLLNNKFRLEVAKLDLRNGKVSLETGAYASAKNYFESGLECLRPFHWSQAKGLFLDLHSSAANACYLGGLRDDMNSHLDTILERDDISIEEKIPAYLTLIRAHGSQLRSAEAARTAIHVLKKLGILNLRFKPGIPKILMELVKTRRLLRGHTQQTLVDLPELNDKKIRMAMSVIDAMAVPTFFASPELHAVIDFVSLQWTLRYGVSKFAPIHFATYALHCSATFPLKVWADISANVTKELMKRFNGHYLSAKCCVILVNFALHAHHPMRECVNYCWSCYQQGMHDGEIEMAMQCRGDHITLKYLTGAQPLDALLEDTEAVAAMMKRYKQETARIHLLMVIATLKVLIYGEDFEEEIQASGFNDFLVACGYLEYWHLMCKFWELQAAYYMGSYDKACSVAAESKDYCLTRVPGQYFASRHLMFRALSGLAIAATGRSRRKHIRAARQIERTLNNWTRRGAVHCLHKACLVKAEIAAVARPNQAEKLFQKAIRSANCSGHEQDKALAHERAGVFFLRALNDEYWATFHIQEAIKFYKDWGGRAKVAQLQRHYKDVLASSEGIEEQRQAGIDPAYNEDNVENWRLSVSN